jgi:hypothetical protein
MTLAAVVPDIAFSGTSGSGTMGPFSLVKNGTPLVFYANSEVVVLRYDSVTDTTPTLLTEGTHYTLTGGPTAGLITLISPSTGLLTAERLYVTTASALAQGLDLVNGGNFSSANLERRLDVIFQILQQHARDIKSTIRFALFDTDEIPRTTPLGAVIDKIPYLTGTAASPTVGYLDVLALNDLSELSEQALEDIATVAADLASADTIGIVAAGMDDVEDVADALPVLVPALPNMATVAEALNDGTIGDLLDGQVGKSDTYAALTAIPASARVNDMIVLVASRTTDGDGAHGSWRFDSASSVTANGGTILAPDTGTGRWIRICDPGSYNVRWFGAVGNGTTSDSSAIQSAINVVKSAGGGTLFFPAGVYRITTALNATNMKGVILEGVGSAQPTYDFGNVFPRTGTVLLGVTGAGKCVLDLIGGASCIVRNMAIVTLAAAGFGAAEPGASQIGILTGTSASGAPDGMGGTAVNFYNLAIVMHNGGTGAPTVPIYGLSHNLDEWHQIWTLGNYGIFTAVANILSVSPEYVAFGSAIGGFNHAMSSINLLGYGTAGHAPYYAEQSNHVTISQLYIGNIYGGAGALGNTFGMYLKDCQNYTVDLAVDYFSYAIQLAGFTAKLVFRGTTYPNLTPINSGQPLAVYMNAPTNLQDCKFDITVTRNSGQTFPNNNYHYVGIQLPRISNVEFLINNATAFAAYMDALSASPPPFFNVQFNGPDDTATVGLLVAGAPAALADYRLFRNGNKTGTA